MNDELKIIAGYLKSQWPALAVLGIAAATSLIATFLPVYGIARRRPVDSIRAL